MRLLSQSKCFQKYERFVQRRCHNATKLHSLSVAYQPQQVEDEAARPPAPSTRQCRGKFRMILPPPNVTGSLHLGHALMATLQDVICRQRRQLGYDVIWVPGTDHAGIATQVVVEKQLQKEHSLSRHQLGRDAFLDKVHKWKSEKSHNIVDDLRKLGCTLDWTREYFTMDEAQAKAVNTAFIRLFEDGLIQRRESLVNWSCTLESALSDIEVDTLELTEPTNVTVPGYDEPVCFGRIYDIAYRLCEADGSKMSSSSSIATEEVVISTTRPETLLGDVAVAVHPNDERYMHLRQQNAIFLWHPFREEPIPLIFDVRVEPEFGTGAVKITPAHDRNDFEIAERHLLRPQTVFTQCGRIVESLTPDFAGLPRFVAREKIIQRLSEMKLLRSVRDHTMSLPICSRSKDVIEYMLLPQWFLHCQPLADAAASEVRSGRLRILPPNFEIEWYRWLDNCHDWCISRQLWWGHQIPAFEAKRASDGQCKWVAAHTEEEARQKAEKLLNTTNLSSLRRDPDVLDTWFSAALLPFSAFGWPTEEYRSHYPLDLMQTGHDILFFWVARMAMLGLRLTGQAPFQRILLNGIVCDAHGRKMSKSLGNVVTPQQVVQGASLQAMQGDVEKSHKAGILNTVELKKSLLGLKKLFPTGIPACGTDALRLTLCSHNASAHFINFDVAECHTNKLFLNKVWQATRYTLNAAERLSLPLFEIETLSAQQVTLNPWDRWILSRLAVTMHICSETLETYNFHTATAALKQFLYTQLCDVYLETTKAAINEGRSAGYIHCATLAGCLSWSLQALSPYTPFVAAKLLSYLPQHIQIDLNSLHDPALESEITEVLGICHSIRQLKSRRKISRKHEPRIHLFPLTVEGRSFLEPYLEEIKTLTLSNTITLSDVSIEDKVKQQQHNNNNSFFFGTAGHLCSFALSVNEKYQSTSSKDEDITTVTGLDSLNARKLAKLVADLDRFRVRVESEGFRRSASEEVQLKHQKKMKQLETEIAAIKSLCN